MSAVDDLFPETETGLEHQDDDRPGGSMDMAGTVTMKRVPYDQDAANEEDDEKVWGQTNV